MSPESALFADARWVELEGQTDLDWDLDAITNRQEAIDFLLHFENRLCVYSGYVEKLYSRYSFVVPEQEHGSITILPDEMAWHDTFHDIPADAVLPTGIHILPGEVLGASGLYLKIPGEHRLSPSHELPFIPRNPAVSPPNHGPLSEAKITSVRSSSPSRWSVSSTRPTL